MRGGDRRVPLVILAGGARKDEAVADKLDRIFGPKGAVLRIAGRPLIDVVVEAFDGCGAFHPIVVAGPADRYGSSCGVAEVVDTDGTFSENIAAGLESILARANSPTVAFTACDLIPDRDELARVMADYFAHVPLDFFYPVVRVPPDRAALGTSHYKRQYLLWPEGEEEQPVAILPGHLVIVNPHALRLELIQRAFELAYRSRTRPVIRRAFYITGGVLVLLLAEDVKAVFRLRPPLFTLEALWNALFLAIRLARGTISQREIETRLRFLFGSRRYRRGHRGSRGRIPVTDALSLARDVDTFQEAEEFALET